MAMHLQLSDAGPGGRPSFMITGSGAPWWWELFRSPVAAIVGIVVVPGLLALLLGLSVFRRRVKGAMFVPVVGIISPNNVGVVPSIGVLIGVAVGGRATLLGPVLGALAVSYAGSELSARYESVWIYVQGLLFIAVVTFMPGGLAGAVRMLPPS